MANLKDYIKSFNFKVKTEDERDIFTRFQLYSVYMGATTHEMLVIVLRAFLDGDLETPGNWPKHMDLITEPEAVSRIRSEYDIKINRAQLNMMRKQDMVGSEKYDVGVWWYTNPSGSIVYNWHRLKQLIELKYK